MSFPHSNHRNMPILKYPSKGCKTSCFKEIIQDENNVIHTFRLTSNNKYIIVSQYKILENQYDDMIDISMKCNSCNNKNTLVLIDYLIDPFKVVCPICNMFNYDVQYLTLSNSKNQIGNKYNTEWNYNVNNHRENNFQGTP